MLMPKYDEKLHIASEKALSFREGKESIRRLISILLKQGRYEDLERISTDDEYLEQLLEEFGIKYVIEV